MNPVPRVVLQCPQCRQQIVDELPRLLRTLGMLRRTSEVDVELLWQLLPSAAEKMSCTNCGHTGLVARAQDDADEEDWPQAPTCKVCGALIPAERLEVFPDTRYCARCQQGQEKPAASREFCPRCGAELRMRSSGRGGVTRYKMACDACGYRG